MRGPTSVLPRAQHTRFIRRGERQLMATSGEAFRRLAIRWPAMRELRRAAHTVYSLHYHFVFTTKYRKPVLVGEIGHSVRDLIRESVAVRTSRFVRDMCDPTMFIDC